MVPGLLLAAGVRSGCNKSTVPPMGHQGLPHRSGDSHTAPLQFDNPSAELRLVEKHRSRLTTIHSRCSPYILLLLKKKYKKDMYLVEVPKAAKGN